MNLTRLNAVVYGVGAGLTVSVLGGSELTIMLAAFVVAVFYPDVEEAILNAIQRRRDSEGHHLERR